MYRVWGATWRTGRLPAPPFGARAAPAALEESVPAGIVVGELLFGIRLGSGETHLFGSAFVDGTGGPSREFVRAFPFGSGQYVPEVRFEESALPVHATAASARPPADAARGGTNPLRRAAPRGVHLVEQAQRPGIVGIDREGD